MRTRIIIYLGIASVLVWTYALLPGCSSDDDGGGNGSPPLNENPIGPAGGTVTSSDGNVEIVFPAGAVNSEIQVTVEAEASPTQGDGMILNRAYGIGPDDVPFQQPVQVTISYDPADIPGGVDEDDLGLCKEEGGVWEEVSGSTVDTQNHSVTGQVSEFSKSSGRGYDLTGFSTDYTCYCPGVVLTTIPGSGFDAYFMLMSTLSENSCSFPVPMSSSIRITIEGNIITFDGMVGIWGDPIPGTGTGTRQITIPINPGTGCYATATSTYFIRFQSTTHFTGTFHVTYEYTPECDTDDCSYTYDLEGTRF